MMANCQPNDQTPEIVKLTKYFNMLTLFGTYQMTDQVEQGQLAKNLTFHEMA